MPTIPDTAIPTPITKSKPMDLKEAQARLAELDRKSRILEEKIDQDEDTRKAHETLEDLPA